MDRLPGDLQTLSSYFTSHQLFSVLNDSRIGMVVCDRRFRYKALNQCVAEIHNVPIKAHLGYSFHQILGSFTDKVLPLWEAVFATGRAATNLEVTGKLPRRRGTGRWVENLFPLRDDRGRLTHVGCIVIETTPPIPDSHFSNPARKARSVTDTQVPGQDQHPRIPLSHREEEVLRLLAGGRSNKEISTDLAISVRTVETYRARLMLKIHATSVVHLVQYAIRNHIVDI